MSGRDGPVLNLNLQGFGQRPGAWRAQDVSADAQLTAPFWADLVAGAERGRFDTVFVADRPAIARPDRRPNEQAEPLALAAALAAASTDVGIVVSASTTYNDPVDLAARLLTLDVVSGGRIGWNVVTTYSDAASANFGLTDPPGRTIRYQRAEEFVSLVRALWASAGGGPAVDHRGEHFRHTGRLDIPPSAQGRPAVFQAGGSEDGQRLAAREADAVFTAELTMAGARRNRRRIGGWAAEAGRAHAPLVCPGLSMVLGSTTREAQDLFDELEALGDDDFTLDVLSEILGTDASALDRNQPIPADLLGPLEDPNLYRFSLGYRQALIDLHEAGPLTVADVLRSLGGYGTRIVVGTPEQVVDEMQAWHGSGACDGFTIMLDRLPDGLDIFVDQVVPLMKRRGFHRDRRRGSTLRERLHPTVATRPRATHPTNGRS